MQNTTDCRDECPNSRLCHKTCPESGDYEQCCDYWHFEELKWDAECERRAELAERDRYEEQEGDEEDE